MHFPAAAPLVKTQNPSRTVRTAHTPAAAAATRQASSASVKPLLRKNFLICSIVVTPICCIVYALLLGLVWDSRAGFMHSFI